MLHNEEHHNGEKFCSFACLHPQPKKKEKEKKGVKTPS
jgi:hypothetical protein